MLSFLDTIKVGLLIGMELSSSARVLEILPHTTSPGPGTSCLSLRLSPSACVCVCAPKNVFLAVMPGLSVFAFPCPQHLAYLQMICLFTKKKKSMTLQESPYHQEKKHIIPTWPSLFHYMQSYTKGIKLPKRRLFKCSF